MASQGISGKKVVVYGAQKGTVDLIQYLTKNGALVTLATQESPESLEAWVSKNLADKNIPICYGPLTLNNFEGQQMIVIAEGSRIDAQLYEFSRTLGLALLSELEFVSLYSSTPCIAIAGTNGKSSTALILEKFLHASGKKTFSNVEEPLAALLNKEESYDYNLVCCTPNQLNCTQSFTPIITLLLNLSPDQIDEYNSFENYLAAQREVLKNTNQSTSLILNAHDQNIIAFVQGLPGRCIFFGNQEVPEGFEGIWQTPQGLKARLKGQTDLIHFDLKLLRLRGTHNRENLMAATTAALLLGVAPEKIQENISLLRAPKGRVKFVKKLNDVAFYNDSCSANPHAVMRSLASFNEPLILIMGGRDKELNFEILTPHIRQRVKNLVLVGEAKEKINRTIGDFTETFIVGTVEEAVLISYQKSRSGDVVLFSPGCSAKDSFDDETHRGEHFSKLIASLARPRKPNVI